MVIFLFGPDEYRRAQKKKEIVAEFAKKRSRLGIGSFDLAITEDIEHLKEFLKNQSIFETAKCAVIENAFEVDVKILKPLLEPLAAEKNITVLISVKDKPVKALAFLLEKPVLSQKFENLLGAEWTAFIKDEAKKNDMALSPSAAEFLGNVYAGDTWGLATELQKLAGFKSTIDKKDLNEFDFAVAPDYWGLVNGMKSFDIKNRLFALETLFALNDPAPKIFNIVAAGAGEKAPRMAEYDLAVKSGKLEYEEVLLDLAIGG